MYQTLDVAQIERRNADFALGRSQEYNARDIYNEQQEHKGWSTQYKASPDFETLSGQANDTYMPIRNTFEAMSGQVNDTYMPIRNMKANMKAIRNKYRGYDDDEMFNAPRATSNNNNSFPGWIIWAPIGILILLILTFKIPKSSI